MKKDHSQADEENKEAIIEEIIESIAKTLSPFVMHIPKFPVKCCNSNCKYIGKRAIKMIGIKKYYCCKKGLETAGDPFEYECEEAEEIYISRW